MANTTFSGPVRSQNGFESISVNSTTGAVTVDATIGPATSVTSVTVSSFIDLPAILTAALPTAAAANATTTFTFTATLLLLTTTPTIYSPAAATTTN